MNLEDYLIDLEEDPVDDITAEEDIMDPTVRENKEKASRQRYAARNRTNITNRNHFLRQKRKLLHLDDETSE